jgi:hypothetical protein
MQENMLIVVSFLIENSFSEYVLYIMMIISHELRKSLSLEEVSVANAVNNCQNSKTESCSRLNNMSLQSSHRHATGHFLSIFYSFLVFISHLLIFVLVIFIECMFHGRISHSSDSIFFSSCKILRALVL